MIFKTTITDINKMAVAIDKISTMTLPDYSGLGIAIEGLTAKQASLVLSTRNLSQAELEEVVIQNDLISKYGAEQLVKTGLLSKNSSLLISEKAVNTEKLKEKIIQESLNKEKAKEFIQTQLSIVSDGEESTSTIILNKALMDEAIKRGILTKEKAYDILSTYGVINADKLETGSKKGLIKTIGKLISAKKSLIASTVGITALVTIMYKLSNVTGRLRERAQELGDSFKEASSTIDDYKSKIEELYKVINDESSSIEDTTNARKSLLSIQDELIDKFGTEEGVINNVTNAINGQTEALDELSKSKWQEVKNDFTHGGFWNDVANFFQGTDNIKRMFDEYGEKTISISWADYADINKLTDEMVAELENIGIDIKVSTDNLQAVRDFDSLTESIEDTKGASLSLFGNAEEIYNKLLALQNLIGNDDSFDKLYDKVGNTADSYKELIDQYKNFYDQYILQEKILTKDSKYADTFKSITDAAEKYNEAFTSGDESKIKEATDEYANLVSTAMADAIANGDADVATYFKNMYPELQSVVNGWNFNVAFDANTDDLQGKVQNVLDELKDEDGRSLTSEEILGLGESNEQYQALVSIAHAYNMTIERMIELLKERNLVSAMDYQGLVSLFGQDNVDKFSPEDLEIAYTIENVGSMTFEQLQNEIQKTKEIVSATPTPLSITETVNQIDTRLKSAFSSLKSAYQEIFTLDEDTGEKLFTSLDEADITDKFKPILDALNSLNEIDGVTVDYSSYEDFVSVLSDTSSTAKDVQEQFDKLATDIIYTSDCTNMSAETFHLLAESLSEMGVTNAYEILGKIRDAQEELADAGYDVTTITSEEAKELINLGIASVETEEYLRQYLIQKQLAQNPLSTLEDILQLESLCNALGVTGQLYEYVIDLKRAFAAKEGGAVSSGLDESIESIQAKIKELSNGEFDFGFNFSAANTKSSSSGSSSSAKDTTETFDWIEQAIENVENEIKELDEVVNSSYSTFSQKNEALAQEIRKVSDEIDLQQQAYTEYMRKANSVGLSDQYKQLVQSGAINIEDIADENLQKMIDEYQKWYEKAQSVSDAIKQLKTDMKDLYVSAYELQTGNLKDRLDSDSITQKQYLDGLKEAYEKFYADLEDFAEQYHEAVLDYLAEEKKYLNDVASAAASIVDTEIDKIQKDADSQESIIQKQIDLLEEKKKPLQDELDALADKAHRENLILNLQKAQYELARSENQRTKLLYKDGQMVYTSDPEAIRDAQEGVDDAKLEIQKQSIQDQIDALDDEIDRYNDLIDQINKAADTQIDALEQIKNKWQEVIDQQEHAKNISLLMGEFGTDAVTKILTGNDDDLLAQWKNNYITALAGIDMESQGYIGDMTQQIASLYDVDLSPLQSQFQNVTDSLGGVKDALGNAVSAIGTGINVPVYDQNSGEPSNANESLSGSITNLGTISDNTLPNVTSNIGAIEETAINAASEVSNVADAIENIPESKDVTINIHTVGGNASGGISSKVSQIAYTGNAYADGTQRAEKGLAVVGEEKPEVIVTNDKKALIAEQPTLVNMEGGETVFDGDETAKMLKARGLRPVSPDEFPLLKVFSQFSPEEIRQRFSLGHVSPPNSMTASAVQNAGNVSNTSNNKQTYTTGDIHIHCPGITKDEVARQIGTELTNVFSGLSLKAYQRANITR